MHWRPLAIRTRATTRNLVLEMRMSKMHCLTRTPSTRNNTKCCRFRSENGGCSIHCFVRSRGSDYITVEGDGANAVLALTLRRKPIAHGRIDRADGLAACASLGLPVPLRALPGAWRPCKDTQASLDECVYGVLLLGLKVAQMHNVIVNATLEVDSVGARTLIYEGKRYKQVGGVGTSRGDGNEFRTDDADNPYGAAIAKANRGLNVDGLRSDADESDPYGATIAKANVCK